MDELNNPFATPGTFAGQAKALLLLYSPRVYGTQVIRPFAYGFTDKALDMLMNGGPTMSAALSRKDIAASQEIASTIRPDDGMNSVSMDMNLMSNSWTFMLVIKQPNNYRGVAMSASGVRTTVMTGYCIGEPANPFTLHMSTPTMNPACQFIVQNRQVLNDSAAQIDAYGMRSASAVMWNDDIIDPSINMLATNRDLYYMTPSKVLDNYDYSGTEAGSISTPGMCAVSANDRTPIQATLKTPGVHLKQIVESLDSQNKEAQLSEFSPQGISAAGSIFSPADDIEAYKSGVVSKLSSGSAAAMIQSGPIDAMSVFTLNDLNMAYPNLDISIQKFTNNTAQYEVVPQTIVNPVVAYSSFVSSAVSSLASDVGLNSIDFMYTSYDPAKRNNAEKDTFQVVSNNVYLTCPPQNPEMLRLTLAGAVDSFRQLFRTNVAPFITGVLGHFTLTARYLSNGETLVDLKLLDYGSNTNMNGWYESPNRLSSFSSTSIGSEAAFTNNAQSLNALVLKTQGKSSVNSMGVTALPTGAPMDSAPCEIPNPSGFGMF